MNKDVLTVLATGKQYQLKPIGEVRAFRACVVCMHFIQTSRQPIMLRTGACTGNHGFITSAEF